MKSITPPASSNVKKIPLNQLKTENISQASSGAKLDRADSAGLMDEIMLRSNLDDNTLRDLGIFTAMMTVSHSIPSFSSKLSYNMYDMKHVLSYLMCDDPGSYQLEVPSSDNSFNELLYKIELYYRHCKSPLVRQRLYEIISNMKTIKASKLDKVKT